MINNPLGSPWTPERSLDSLVVEELRDALRSTHDCLESGLKHGAESWSQLISLRRTERQDAVSFPDLLKGGVRSCLYQAKSGLLDPTVRKKLEDVAAQTTAVADKLACAMGREPPDFRELQLTREALWQPIEDIKGLFPLNFTASMLEHILVATRTLQTRYHSWINEVRLFADSADIAKNRLIVAARGLALALSRRCIIMPPNPYAEQEMEQIIARATTLAERFELISDSSDESERQEDSVDRNDLAFGVLIRQMENLYPPAKDLAQAIFYPQLTPRYTNGAAPPGPPRESKPSGSSDTLILAALNAHHRYDGTSLLNDEPVGVRELSEKLDGQVSPTTVSRWFKDKWDGHKAYNVSCANGRLLTLLKVLNGDVSPRQLLDPAQIADEIQGRE